MKIAIGADHAGFAYKEEVKKFLAAQGHEITDFGTYSESSADYADFAHPVANAVEEKNADFGILLCGSGNGICMTANKHQAVRAALCWHTEIAVLARQHNDANILCMPARYISVEQAKIMVEQFLKTPFEGGRHTNRVQKIAVC